jgi:hypothetical protein
MRQMILPNRMTIAVADACNTDVANMAVFLPNGDELVQVPMSYAVLALRSEVAAEDRAREHRKLERAAKARKE